MRLQASISVLFLLSSLSSTHATSREPKDARTRNANHIFNAIHSSMRQWGSSLNHNGMSFFMATVPAGTQLYHGTSNPESVKGMEWLAFEPEHALIFARPRGPPGGRKPPPEDGDRDGEEEHGNFDGAEEGYDSEYEDEWGGHEEVRPKRPHHPYESPNWDDSHLPPPPPPGHPHGPPGHDMPHYGPPSPPPPPGHPHMPPPPHHGPPPPPPHKRQSNQSPLLTPSTERPSPPPFDEPTNLTGYLHTYTPTHPLTLLYIDGLSAGKTSNGTLDTQDKLLLNLSSSDPHGPMGGEFARAAGLCNLSRTLWDGKIDGVLRMEGGFEIILCDFEEKLEVVDIMEGGSNDGIGRGREGVMGGWQYIKALTSRYHGIGGGRVELDYEHFVSVFEYEGLGLWRNDVVSDMPQPRLLNARPEQLREIKDAVTSMILDSDRKEEKGKNWQEVADMVVTRYSTPLHHLHTDKAVRRSKESFAAYLATLLRPFVSPSSRNTTLEIQRCVSQSIPPLPLPPKPAPSLAHTTLHTVTSEICSSLLTAFDITQLSMSRSLAPTSPPPSHAVDVIDSLVRYLQWTTWKECGACADEQVCFVPIWPMGSHEDHASPKCTREGDVGAGYWGRFGPGHGRGPPERGEPPSEGGPPRHSRLPEDGDGRGRPEMQGWRRGHGHGRGRGGGRGDGGEHIQMGHRGGKHGQRGHGHGCGHSRPSLWGRLMHAVGRLAGVLQRRPRIDSWYHRHSRE